MPPSLPIDSPRPPANLDDMALHYRNFIEHGVKCKKFPLCFQGGHPRVQPLHGQELVPRQVRPRQSRAAVPQLLAGRDGKGEREKKEKGLRGGDKGLWRENGRNVALGSFLSEEHQSSIVSADRRR